MVNLNKKIAYLLAAIFSSKNSDYFNDRDVQSLHFIFSICIFFLKITEIKTLQFFHSHTSFVYFIDSFITYSSTTTAIL